MRKTFRNTNNKKYWRNRWKSLIVDEPMNNENSYPLKYSNMVVKSKNENILEAGCGGGRILRYYHNKGYKIYGVDFIGEIIEKVRQADPSLKIYKGDILNLEFENSFFDTILAFGLYHNFYGDNLHKSLKETHRVLKNSGTLCASFRADNLQGYIIDFIRKNNSSKSKEFHKLNLKKKEFINLLESEGFTVKDVFSVQNMPFLYKFKFFRHKNHKTFNENKSRIEGYKLSILGNFLQNFLLNFFPDSFCNIYLIIAKKS